MKSNAFDNFALQLLTGIYILLPARLQKLITPQIWRYGICGATNVLFDWVLYFVLYNFVICHRNVNLIVVTLSPHIAALAFSVPVSLTTGFYLQRHISFPESTLHRHTQIWRYVSVYIVNILLNYVFLKLFVDALGFFPTPSKILTTFIVTIFSFLAQKHFTFRHTKKD